MNSCQTTQASEAQILWGGPHRSASDQHFAPRVVYGDFWKHRRGSTQKVNKLSNPYCNSTINLHQVFIPLCLHQHKNLLPLALLQSNNLLPLASLQRSNLLLLLLLLTQTTSPPLASSTMQQLTCTAKYLFSLSHSFCSLQECFE